MQAPSSMLLWWVHNQHLKGSKTRMWRCNNQGVVSHQKEHCNFYNFLRFWQSGTLRLCWALKGVLRPPSFFMAFQDLLESQSTPKSVKTSLWRCNNQGIISHQKEHCNFYNFLRFWESGSLPLCWALKGVLRPPSLFMAGLPKHAWITIDTQKDQNFLAKMQLTGDHQSPGTELNFCNFLRFWESGTLGLTWALNGSKATFFVSGLWMHCEFTIDTQEDQNFLVKMQLTGCHQPPGTTMQLLQFSMVPKKWASATLLGTEGGLARHSSLLLVFQHMLESQSTPKSVKTSLWRHGKQGIISLREPKWHFHNFLQFWESGTLRLCWALKGALRPISLFLAFQCMLESQSTPKRIKTSLWRCSIQGVISHHKEQSNFCNFLRFWESGTLPLCWVLKGVLRPPSLVMAFQDLWRCNNQGVVSHQKEHCNFYNFLRFWESGTLRLCWALKGVQWGFLRRFWPSKSCWNHNQHLNRSKLPCEDAANRVSSWSVSMNNNPTFPIFCGAEKVGLCDSAGCWSGQQGHLLCFWTSNTWQKQCAS